MIMGMPDCDDDDHEEDQKDEDSDNKYGNNEKRQ